MECEDLKLIDESSSTVDFPIESIRKQNETKMKYKGSLDLNVDILDKDQWKAFDLIMNAKNVHICGPAGSGKSLLLTYVVKALRVLKLKVAITATTGIAANNLNSSGMETSATTLHWWMGTGGNCGTPEKEAENLKMYKSDFRWKDTDVLIIDEVSMLSPELFEKIEKIARIIRCNPAPFGGIQVILCGDWFQLEPVREKKISEKYR